MPEPSTWLNLIQHHPAEGPGAIDDWAESRGLILLVVSEHHAAEDGYLPSPLPMAAALAARTTSVVQAATRSASSSIDSLHETAMVPSPAPGRGASAPTSIRPGFCNGISNVFAACRMRASLRQLIISS